MIDINLGGVWKTVKAGVPHILAGGNGGSIILTSSVGGLKAYPHTGHYVAAKHGVVGLMRTFAVELGAQNIRVNSVHPTNVNTPLFMNEGTIGLFRPDLENPGPDDMKVVWPADAHPADRLGRTRGHRQRGAVSGIRRGAVRHRRHAPRRRWQLPEVAARRGCCWTAIPPIRVAARSGGCSPHASVPVCGC